MSFQAQAFSKEIHSDLWGPSPVVTIGGHKYYVMFTDEYTQYMHLDLLKTKDQTFAAYKVYVAWAKTQHSAHIKQLHSDHGGKFLSSKFTNFLQEQGMEHHLTTHNTPLHNGIAESLNWQLVEHMHTILHHSRLPKYLWGEAILFIVWLRNRTLTQVLGNITPYKLLNGNKPDLSGMPKWGQTIWVHDGKGSKLDAHAGEAKWVGFDHDSTHAHCVYWPNKHCVSIECDITFVPTVPIYLPPVSGMTVTPQITIGKPISSSQQPLVMPLSPTAIPVICVLMVSVHHSNSPLPYLVSYSISQVGI
jgi:hypothetical protein